MSEAVQLAKTIAEHFKGNEFTDEALASALGHGAAKSGAFRQKVADLRKFGIVDGRGATLRASSIAQSLYADHPGDGENATKAMLQKIPIFKAIYDQFGGQVPDDRVLIPALLNITGAPRPEVEREAAKLRELYKDASGMVSSMPSGPRPQGGLSPTFERGLGTPSHGPVGGGRRFESSTEDYQFSVADEPEAIESVVEQLQARKRILERRREHGTPPSSHPTAE